MAVRNILYSDKYPINEHISIEIPMVKDVLEHENDYYSMITLLTATPFDLMAQLDEMGIDFTKIDDYELFFIVMNTLRTSDTSMVFGELDITRLSIGKSPHNDTLVLIDDESGIMIDRAMHSKICDALRKIHRLKRNIRKSANEASKKFLLERARVKMKRKRKSDESSHLEDLIIALVNTEQFSYRFEDVHNLTIYQFNESLHQVIKKTEFDNKMYGIYAGTVNVKDMKPGELNWLAR